MTSTKKSVAGPSAKAALLNQDFTAAMQNQPTVSVGFLGHVAHGKSTITRALSGVATGKSRDEQIRNMTIKLGYANIKVYKCSNEACPRPLCYRSIGSGHKEWNNHSPTCSRPGCGSKMTLTRHVSLVDSPGHHDLMATMLSGACIMDGAILVISADEKCPRPQTQEHLIAATMMGEVANNMIIVQNKIDLKSIGECQASRDEIVAFVKDTPAETAPIIPIAGNLGFNVDVLSQYICERIKEPAHDLESPARMIIIRSFDVNKPGKDVFSLTGGIIGGTVVQGVLHVNDLVEIRPGIVRSAKGGGEMTVTPIVTRIKSLKSEDHALSAAYPGGLIAAGLSIDPSLAKQDRLVGNVMGAPGTLPPIFREFTMKYDLLRGSTPAEGGPVKKEFSKEERLQVCIGSHRVEASVLKHKKSDESRYSGKLHLMLTMPVCAEAGATVAIFRSSDHHWRLIGKGVVSKFTSMETFSVGDSTKSLNKSLESNSTSASSSGKVIASKTSQAKSAAKSADTGILDTAPTEIVIEQEPHLVAADSDSKKSAASGSGSAAILSTASIDMSVSSTSTSSASSSVRDLSMRNDFDSKESDSAATTSVAAESKAEHETKKEKAKKKDDAAAADQSGLDAKALKRERRKAKIADREKEQPVSADSNSTASSASSTSSTPSASSPGSAGVVDEDEQIAKDFSSQRFYRSFVPNVGDVVAVKVTKIDADVGVFYRLLSYGNLEGLAMASEISVKRLKNLKQVVSEDMEDVAIVMKVDPIKRTVDLSRKRVSKEESHECKEAYKKSRSVHTILGRTSQLLQGSEAVTLAQLYQQIGWPLYDEFEHALDAFHLALHDPTLAFASCSMSEKTKETLLNVIKQKLKIRPVRVRSNLMITHFGATGAESICAALNDAVDSCDMRKYINADEKSAKSEDFVLRFAIDTPPSYYLQATCLSKDEAVAKLDSLKGVIRDKLTVSGGIFKEVGDLFVSSM